MVDTLISGEARETLLTSTAQTNVALEARETLLTSTARTNVAMIVRETLLQIGSPVFVLAAGVAREVLLAPPPPPINVSGIARETLYSMPTTRVLTWKFGW